MHVLTKFLLLVGFNVETVNYKNVNFTAWDVGGRDKIVSAVIKFLKFRRAYYKAISPNLLRMQRMKNCVEIVLP